MHVSAPVMFQVHVSRSEKLLSGTGLSEREREREIFAGIPPPSGTRSPGHAPHAVRYKCRLEAQVHHKPFRSSNTHTHTGDWIIT